MNQFKQETGLQMEFVLLELSMDSTGSVSICTPNLAKLAIEAVVGKLDIVEESMEEKELNQTLTRTIFPCMMIMRVRIST